MSTHKRKNVDMIFCLCHFRAMQTSRTRKTINTSLDPKLIARLHQWRKSQTAEVPFGRALDACIRAFLDQQDRRRTYAAAYAAEQKAIATERPLYNGKRPKGALGAPDVS
jgi:hypothetical protein